MEYSKNEILRRTRSAFIWTRLLGIPFWTLVNMLSIMLYKDLHISNFQITLIIALKPMSALLAPYWSQAIHQRPDRVNSNLVWSHILRFLPFLFMPWMQSSWLIILSFFWYMMLYRGAMPAWMETFKRNFPDEARERIFAYVSALDYCVTAALPIALGFLLDDYEQAWRWLFPITAFLGLISTLFLYRLPRLDGLLAASVKHPILIKDHILKPWKEVWTLMKERPDFAAFQIGFMLGGAGLIIMQPALPAFFVDTLQLSYTKMLLALAVCKGIGFAAASPAWTKLYRKWNLYTFTAWVTGLAALFPFLLLSAEYYTYFLYLAYGLYGVMQAGSELSWHMSGPAFSKEKDSSLYSGTNILTVGIRGCFVPLLGSCLLSATNSVVVMIVGAFLCMMATRHLLRYSSPLPASQEA